jgi:ribosomal protein L11 methyltransferase
VNSSSPKTWFAIEVFVIPGGREAIEYGLMEAGALGTQTDEQAETVSVVGYFESQPDVASVHATLTEALRIYGFDSSAIVDLKDREFADRDWLAEWKKSWQPVQVGRFVIAPPWIESIPGAVATGSFGPNKINDPLAIARGTDTIVIRINPGMAFGTGTHETTRLCLKAIEKHFRGGSFLDVGTGTGILAIAAARMCQKPDREGGQVEIRALDIDASAIEIAKENAALNGVSSEIDFRAGSVDEQTPSADFVCANLTAPVIVELLPALSGATCGRLVLSGILDSQVDFVRARLAELGIVDFEIDQDGEWIAVVI